MKKYIFIVAIGACLALTACGNESTTTETTDSGAVTTDTTSLSVDTTSVSVDTTASTPDVQVVK